MTNQLVLTINDQAAEIAALKKACATALSVIEGMRASSQDIELAFDREPADDSEEPELNEAHLFGGFTQFREYVRDSAGYDAHCIIEWPDLDLAAQDLRKVLP